MIVIIEMRILTLIFIFKRIALTNAKYKYINRIELYKEEVKAIFT